MPTIRTSHGHDHSYIQNNNGQRTKEHQQKKKTILNLIAFI